MVEEVERLKTQFELLGFSNLRGLQQCHVEVVEAGTVEEAALGIPELPYLLVAEESNTAGDAVVFLPKEGDPDLWGHRGSPGPLPLQRVSIRMSGDSATPD